MLDSRFAFDKNVSKTGTYKDYNNAFWPPNDRYLTYTMNLMEYSPDSRDLSYDHLEALRHCIEVEHASSQFIGRKRRNDFHLRDKISSSMTDLARSMKGVDQEALLIRANAITNGYSEQDLRRLASIRPNISIVAGNISTWYGKAVAGRPTAFGCVVNHETNEAIKLADANLPDLEEVIRDIDLSLTLSEAPEFESADVFYMCGEGNLYPKHFAYFVPEDEGIKYSPFKKTYYFNNLHYFMYQNVSKPLLNTITADNKTGKDIDKIIPALWMRGHDYGHFVNKPSTSFEKINAVNRWTSVVLQEASADVFGTIFLLGPWSRLFKYEQSDAANYYVAESLRYIHRGLGMFPDSDGMYCQLSYLIKNNFIETIKSDGKLKIAYSSQRVYEGMCQLALELSDHFLSSSEERSLGFFENYGPSSGYLNDIIKELASIPPAAVNYLQEPRKELK